MSIVNAPIIPNSVMVDRVIGEIQTGLAANLPWLDAAFGRAQRLVKNINGKRWITPNVYCGGLDGKGPNDYLEVSPDSQIGNFSFFVMDDPETLAWYHGQQAEIKAPFALIFWFDLRRVYDSDTNRNTEYLKAQILRILNGRGGWHLGNGRITINKCYEQAQNIYRGFSIDEMDNQFLMHPYAGFRFEGILEFDEICLNNG